MTQLINRGLGTKPIIFVTHSMGGLVVKALISAASKSNDSRVSNLVNKIHGVVFCATPHRGSTFASAAKTLGLLFQPQIHVQEMVRDDTQLDIDHQDFLDWLKRRPIRIESYLETQRLEQKKALGRLVKLPLVVKRPSGNANFGEVYDVDADHFSIVKPSPSYKPIYDVVYLGVKRFIKDAIKWSPPSTAMEVIYDIAEKVTEKGEKTWAEMLGEGGSYLMRTPKDGSNETEGADDVENSNDNGAKND